MDWKKHLRRIWKCSLVLYSKNPIFDLFHEFFMIDKHSKNAQNLVVNLEKLGTTAENQSMDELGKVMS